MAIDKELQFVLGYLDDYYSYAKHPTSVKAKVLLADAGIDSKSANELIAIIQKYGVAKYKARLKAYTKTEKVLQDKIPAEDLAPDYMLINDEAPGDSYDFKDELTIDGAEDEETLDLEQSLLTHDSSFR